MHKHFNMNLLEFTFIHHHNGAPPLSASAVMTSRNYRKSRFISLISIPLGFPYSFVSPTKMWTM